MNAHVTPPANVLRFPPRPRVVTSQLVETVGSPNLGSRLPALDALLSAGTIDARQHATELAYAALRRRFDASGGSRRSWKDTSGLSDVRHEVSKMPQGSHGT